MLEQHIQQYFMDGVDLQYVSAKSLPEPLADAVQLLLACMTDGGKVLACGSGASSHGARLFADLCVAGFEQPRPPLAVLALGWPPALADGQAPAQYLAQQVRALGMGGDALLLLTTDGSDPAALAALEAAHERDMEVVVLCAAGGGLLADRLREGDVLLTVPHARAARVREIHTVMLHCLCAGMDAQLLGLEEEDS